MVTETTENSKTPFNVTAVTGAALGGAALLVQLLSGSFGNILGGGRPPVGEPPWARDMNYERQLTKADFANFFDSTLPSVSPSAIS